MEFQAIVFKSGQVGEVVKITEEDFPRIVEGMYERVYNKHDINIQDTVVIVNAEGALINLPRNRGYNGTFIIVKEDEEGSEYLSFSDKEIKKIKDKLDKKGNFTSQSKYLETFFEEKDLPLEIFTYERGLNIIQLSNYDIIETLISSPDKEMLKQVETIIRKLDFANGDINHFIQHIGNGMADQYTR